MTLGIVLLWVGGVAFERGAPVMPDATVNAHRIGSIRTAVE